MIDDATMQIDACIGYLKYISFYIVTGCDSTCFVFSGALAFFSWVISQSPFSDIRPQYFYYALGFGGQELGQGTVEIE